MDSRAALGAATAVALTVTGGVSALFLTIGQANAAGPDQSTIQPAVVVEYVDQYGTPVAPPTDLVDPGAAPQVIVLNADGTPANTTGHAPAAAPGYAQEEYEEEYEAEEYEEEEYEGEEEEDYEDGDEHEEEEHYEAAAGYGGSAPGDAAHEEYKND